jgi:adenosylmethionine-8-amino-7-oxononanoate aminotransferase
MVSNEQLQRQAREHLLLHFTRNGDATADGELLVIDRGEGLHVYDTEGNRYFDGLSSLFCAQLGYSYGAEMGVVASAQLERLAFNTNWGTAHPGAIELATTLADLAPGDLEHVFFTGGGSESVETAWKLVRQYHVANGEPQRTKAISRAIAYHGVTLGALALTGVPAFKEQFGAPAIPVCTVSNTNRFRSELDEAAHTRALLEEIERTIVAEGEDTIAMLIAEPVQNAGGCLVPPSGYWRGLRELCDRYGILLVADEVITGCGRLGEWFGVTRFDAVPDLITLAKGLTSAYAPMGAVLVSERVAAPLYDARRVLAHGITFGGHPLSAAIAQRNIDIFAREGVLENVHANEQYLGQRLGDLIELPIVGDVRGAGYFWALELVRDGEQERFDATEREELLRGFLPHALRSAGLIARCDDRGDAVLQLAPPLVADTDTLDEMVKKVEGVLSAAGEHMAAFADAARA